MKFLLFRMQNITVDIFLQNSVELCHVLQWRFVRFEILGVFSVEATVL